MAAPHIREQLYRNFFKEINLTTLILSSCSFTYSLGFYNTTRLKSANKFLRLQAVPGDTGHLFIALLLIIKFHKRLITIQLVMAALRSRCGHYIFVLWFLRLSSFFMAALWNRAPLPSNRHHLSNGDCLEGKGGNYQVCSVQYCAQQLCTVRCTHIWTH